MELANTVWMKRIGLAGLGLCAALALAAGRAGDLNTSNGPDDEEEELSGDFSQPLEDQNAAGNSRSTMTTIDGSDSYTVTRFNGKVTVERNGKKLSKSQFRLKNNQIEILDESGKVTKTLPGMPRVGQNGTGGTRSLRSLTTVPLPPKAPGNTFTITRNAPKVMLGVTMSDADPEVLEQIGVDDGGVMLVSVADGLPAATAGLKAKDVIVEADGKPVDGEEALRAILKSKNPGDDLALKIFRKGESQNITVKLAAFDQDALDAINRTVTVDVQGDADSEELAEILKGVEQQVKAQVEALRTQLSATDWNQVRDQVSAALGDAVKQLEAARLQAAEAGEHGIRWWRQNGKNFTMPEGWMQFAQPPTPPAATAPRADVGDKLDRLSEQLEKMNRRLDAMEKQIEKK